MSEFIVDGNYEGYVYVGNAKGNFEDDNGEMRPYYNMYVISPVSKFTSEDYSASGWKAEKKKCVSDTIWQDLVPGMQVKLFFDDKKRVVMAAIDGEIKN